MAAMATSFEFGETVWRQSSAQVPIKCSSALWYRNFPGRNLCRFSYFSVISEGSNVTAFSFIFVEYTKNIYGWSDSAPPGARIHLGRWDMLGGCGLPLWLPVRQSDAHHHFDCDCRPV